MSPPRRYRTRLVWLLTLSLILAVAGVLLHCQAAPGPAGAAPTAAPVTFEPTFDSFKQYQYPQWFRDAKLGIWAHWGPQSVPMMGDWYARQMYVQGHRQYQHHLETYGHPTKAGWKDVIPLWKAEKWDPDRLMALYQKAGAKYFVSMGCHHDNFDLWNSKYHEWNAVNMGPHRDVVGDWQKAAKKLGLRFGVSEHMGASFTWWQDAHKSDKTGPLAGVLYDGADPKFFDLYHWPAAPDDKSWYSKDAKWQAEWLSRVTDLIDNYHPDLLYTDGGVPFGKDADQVGRTMISHLYNDSAQRHGGAGDVVYTCKQQSNGMWVEDLERGVMPGVRPHPWQTDTSIGDWFYNKNWKYRQADWVIQMLVDIVSKNGNLLINVVQRPDGTLDPEAEQILAEMAKWIAINGEAIYDTRPWLVHGEGRVKAKGGHFNEDYKYTASDIRFTTKGEGVLYAFIMGWPEDGRTTIHSLAQFPGAGVTGRITSVALLGGAANLKFRHDAEGLTVELPGAKPCDYAVALKITGTDLRGFKPELAVPPPQALGPDAKGNYVLGADDAEMHGTQIKTEDHGNQTNIGFWDQAGDWASWKVSVKAAGKFKVSANVATMHADSLFVVELAGKALEGKPAVTGAWDKFVENALGSVEFAQAGEQVVKVRAKDAASWKAINLRGVKLTKEMP